MIRNNRKNALLCILLCLGLAVLAGCAAVVAGAGAGAGVYTYISGELKRTYTVDYETAVAAAEQALSALKIKVTERQAGGTETTLTGTRTDQMPVSADIVMVGPKATEIGVRSGVVGYWDKSGSELIHAEIAKRLP